MVPVSEPRSISEVAGPRLRTLLLMAWPVILTRATQSVVGFSDALMVAPLGEASLAAATTGAFDTFVVILFPMGIVFILQSFTSQLRGRGELEAIRRYARYGIAIAGVAGVLALAMVPLVPAIVGTFGYESRVAEPMAAYISIRLLSVGAAVGIEAYGNWYGGLGNTRVPMMASLVTMTTNVALNYLLIEPRWGLPGYGVAGAACASTAATFLGLATIALAFASEYGFELPSGDTRLRADEFASVVRFGAPNGMNWLMEFAAFALFINVVVGSLGTTALAALNVVIQVNSLAFMPAFGLSTAGAILVGEAIGRGRPDDVAPIVRMTVLTGGTWMMLAGMISFAFARPIVGLFASDAGSSLVAVGASMLALSVGWQLFDAIGITLGEALRAAGDTHWCMVARLTIAWVLFVPLAFVAVRVLHGGTTGAMLALTAYLAGLSVALGYRFLSGRWRSIDLLATASSPDSACASASASASAPAAAPAAPAAASV